MKNITKQLNIQEISKKAFIFVLILSFAFVPNFVFADYYGDDWGYGYEPISNYGSGYSYTNSGYSYEPINYNSGYSYESSDWGYSYEPINYNSGYSYESSDWGYGYEPINYDSGYGYESIDWGYGYEPIEYGSDNWGYGYEPIEYGSDTYDVYSYETIDYYASDYGYDYDYDYNYDYGYSYQPVQYAPSTYTGVSYGYRNGYDRIIYDDYRYVAQSNDDLRVRCELSDSTIEEGDEVTIEVEIDGGDGPYDIEWSGDIDDIDDFDDSDQIQTVEFDDEGTYELEVRVEDDDGEVDTDTCTVFVDNDNDDDDFEIQCRISDTRIDEGDEITIEVEIDGGESPFDIEWSGDIDDIDDFDDNDRSQRVEFDERGTYEIEVRVEDDDGNVERDTCPLINVDDEDDNDINVFTDLDSPDGNLAGLSSVYLSQVPYTGPAEDAGKVLGFISLLILWSAIIAFVFVKRREKQERSMQIEAFKEANRIR